MAGVKGRSGRGTHRSDVIRNEVIQKSWEMAIAFLNDSSVEMKDKMEFVSKICVKAMPTHIEADVKESQLIVIRSDQKVTHSVIEHQVQGGREISFD